MAYNKNREEKKWKRWKEQEETLMRKLGVDEEIIRSLREYDWNVFLQDRRIRERQYPAMDELFLNVSKEMKKDITTLSDLLDEIENESLLAYLKSVDKGTLVILLLKVMGYSTQEISTILHISPVAIYHRIHRLRKNFKNL